MAEGADGGRWSRVGGPVGGTFHGEQMGAMAVEPPRLALSVAKATNCEHR